MKVRSVHESEIDQVAYVWHDGWRDTHERILPAELARDRSWQTPTRAVERNERVLARVI